MVKELETLTITRVPPEYSLAYGLQWLWARAVMCHQAQTSKVALRHSALLGKQEEIKKSWKKLHKEKESKIPILKANGNFKTFFEIKKQLF